VKTRWEQNASKLYNTLQQIIVKNFTGDEIDHDKGFLQWRKLAFKARTKGNTLFFIGNGASASMASHFAADVAKNARIRTYVFTDPALITALANDIRYEEVYAEPIRWYMQKGDMLIAISSSGNSPNVVNAVKAAKQSGGTVITLSAMSPDNSICKMGTINFYIPAQTYGMAETAHAAILHFWMDSIEIRE